MLGGWGAEFQERTESGTGFQGQLVVANGANWSADSRLLKGTEKQGMMGTWQKHRQLSCKRSTGKEPEAKALVQEGMGLSPGERALCILERSNRAKSLLELKLHRSPLLPPCPYSVVASESTKR